ncbi:Alpha/Beta hydrolase protein [Xylaria venustula]|nr:Alpha/Beta hydrolase protein [Xylaria venustula]
MASPDQVSYLEKPLNPYIADYDLGLQAHSEFETHRWYSLEKNNAIKRADWRSQRKRRQLKTPTDKNLRDKYGLHRDVRRIRRDTSCSGADYRNLVNDKVISEYIDVVIVHDPTIQKAELGSLPCIFFIHGGCRYGGTPYSGLLERAQEWATRFNAIVVSVNYRLSPNESDGSPTGEEPTNDCFDALAWIYHRLGAEDDEVLRYGDRARTIVFGTSSGGGLAASTLLKWCQERRQGSARTPGDLCGLVLEAPQLDDRCDTQSHIKFRKGNMFTSQDAIQGWNASLGERRGTEHVSIFEAPARASEADVDGFPPTYIEVGAVEPFRDEAENFYHTLRRAGVETKLKVWDGGFHGFFAADPDALVSRVCNLTKLRWLCQQLGASDSGIDNEYEEVKEAYDARLKE